MKNFWIRFFHFSAVVINIAAWGLWGNPISVILTGIFAFQWLLAEVVLRELEK